MINPGTRWQQSVVTFGLPGRLLMSALVLVPMWWFWNLSLFGWPGLLVWGFWVLPRAYRDIWRRAALPVTDLVIAHEESRRETSPELPDTYVPIAERPAPKRW